MKTETADILIVGAGAAGSALACLLARAGRDVLLVERCRAAAKDKLCGGVVTAAGQRLMDELYGEGALDALGAAQLDAMRVLYRDCETSLPMDFRALPRRRFDAFLFEQAVHAGARVAERVSLVGLDERVRIATCKVLDTGEVFHVKYGILVAADGANSTVRRALTGRRARVAVSFVGNAAPSADGATLVQRVYSGVAGGCWLIPQGDAAVVGCLFFPEASSAPVGDTRQRVRKFAAELGRAPVARLRGAPVPTGDDTLLRSPGETYFIGDAAGLAEPALGAGIHLALQSAAALADDLAGGVPYEEAMAPTAARLREDAQEVAFAYLSLGFAALQNDTLPQWYNVSDTLYHSRSQASS